MKRERPEEKHHSNGGFYNSHRQFNLQSPPPHLRHPPLTPEGSDSHDSTKIPSQDGSHPPPNDGSTIEVVRRQRGRPPGSKNKPKTSMEDASEPAMGPYILELSPGVDVIDSTVRFCQRRNIGLCILNGHGIVANVSLKQQSAAAAVTFHGQFDILSITATVFPIADSPPGNGSFTMFLAGPQGQVVGGLVVGPLMSAGTVYLIGATFNSPQFHRLPAADHDDEAANGGGYDRRESSVSGGDSGGAPVYSYQELEVGWVPTARHPPQPPPY